jgi:hypothetical protein
VTARELIRQEIISREQTIVGKVVRGKRIVEFDGSAPVWVVDVDIGAEKLLKKVPVKGGSTLKRSYVDVGQTVTLRRNALGRFDVVGPGDRVAGVTKTKSYDYATGTPTVLPDIGFGYQIESFDYYQGPRNLMSGIGVETVQFALVGGGNDTLTRSGPGSWTTDGFVATKYLFVSGSVSNNGSFGPILIASATVLQFGGDVFVNEGPTVGISVGWGTRWNDSVTPFPVRTTRDAQGNVITD